jgi:hypothetical protein
MDLVVTALLILGIALTARVLVRNVRSGRREEGDLMMDDLAELRTPEERRNYLRSLRHGKKVKRCACSEYALPYPEISVRDDSAMHSLYRCQPAREIIDAP